MGNLCCGLRTDMGPAPEIPPAEAQRQREDQDYQAYLREQQRRDQYTTYPSNPQRSSSYSPPRRESTYGAPQRQSTLGYASYEMQPNGQPYQQPSPQLHPPYGQGSPQQYPQSSPQLHPQYGQGSPQQYPQSSPQLHPRYSVQGVSPQLHPRYSQHVPGSSPSPQMHPYSQSPNMYGQSPNASPNMGAQGGFVPGMGASPIPEGDEWRNSGMKESPKQVCILFPLYLSRLWVGEGFG